MELKSKSINVCDFRKQVRSRTTVDADVIVPDTKPDIFRILTVRARVDMSEKYMRKDKIIYSGNIRFNIIYVGETDRSRIHNIEYTAPFNAQTDVPGADENCQSITACFVEKTDFHEKNSRKLSVSAFVGFDTEVIRQNTVSAVEGCEPDGDVPVKYGEYEFDSMCVCKEIEIPLSESFVIHADPEAGFEVYDVNVKADVSEIKTVNNKAVIKGGGSVHTLCMTDGEIAGYENELSFTQICDLDGISPDMKISSHFGVSNCEYSVSPSGNEVRLEVEITLKGYICAYEHNGLSLARDMYNPDYTYEKKEQNVNLIHKYGPFDLQTTVKDDIALSEGVTELSRIHFMTAMCECKSAEADGSNVIADCVAHTALVYTDAENCLSSAKKSFPFRLEIPADGISSGNDASVKLSCINYGYTLGSDNEIQVRVVVKAEAMVTASEKTALISGFTVDSNTPVDKSHQPSIVICYPDGKEGLWSMAKKYNTTCESIARINGFEPDSEIPAGKPVIIAKRKIASL